MSTKDYEIVIGLEVHTELKTLTKIYCDCTTEFGGEPNTHCCPICTGMPGTLPVLNGMVVEYAIRAGLATDCQINKFSKQDRKNYFYPDLPKAYQVSQFDLPLSFGGHVEIEVDGVVKEIGITRIHIEEDAGKLLHDEGAGSLVDYNRCGIPLIEIVTEPDLRSEAEAKVFLEKLRTLLLYADVSDCKMNEGSLRCDVNLSVRKKGDPLGTRTEMKNMNSFGFIVKAIEYEAKRQIKVLSEGGTIVQETRRWDAGKGITVSMRSKEEAHDYRYFPEPDLMPIVTTEERIEEIRASLPELPASRKARYLKDFGCTAYDADLIVASRRMAEFFELAVVGVKNKKLVANWILSEVFLRLNEEDKEQAKVPFDGQQLGRLVQLIEDGTINNNIAKTVFAKMWDSGKTPDTIIEEDGLKQMNDDGALKNMAKEIVGKSENEKIVTDYNNGKETAIQSLVGQMMKQTKGKANPQVVVAILKEQLLEKKNEV